MQAPDLYRWAGITSLVAGVFNVIVEFVPVSIGAPLELLTNILGLGVLTALYLRQRSESGVLGWVGYVTQFLGMALVIGFLFSDAFVLSGLNREQRAAALAGAVGVVTGIGLAITTVGAILFGIGSLRAGVFHKWAAFLLMLGFVLAPLGAATSPVVKTVGELILSAGLIGVSTTLLSPPGKQIEQELSR
jgi:hypothetical protein